MKKVISALISAVMGISAVIIAPAHAVGETSGIDSVAIFGDSIASGYGLDPEKEYNYGQIIGDYLDCKVENYAVSGDTTFDLLEDVKNLSEEQKNFISGSEVVVISIGGNDLMLYSAKKILAFAADNGFLNEGYTKDNIPENPDISDLTTYISIDAVMDFASTGAAAQLKLGRLLLDLYSNLCFDSGNNENYISKVMIPNITEAVSIIKSLNPDARVIIQSVYQPLQLSPEYMDEKLTGNKAIAAGMVRLRLEAILDDYRTKLAAIEGVEIADILNEFTSLSADKEGIEQGYAYYFTDIQASGEERDFHPNQRGHLAIAAEILDTIGILHDDNGLLTKVYCNLPSADSEIIYPHIALDTYKKVAGNFMLGDVDFNMIINGSDATYALREYTVLGSDGDTLFSSSQKAAADIDKDGIITGSDAQKILSYYTYISSGGKLSMEEFLAPQE
ncbi:MAG: hypothetical protein IJ010_01760 [Ruminococcus sp.]|nr:hypothetical protein [Ruminococcus sp.]